MRCLYFYLPSGNVPNMFFVCVSSPLIMLFSRGAFFFCESLALYAPLLIYWRLRSLASNSSCKLQEMMGCVHYGLKLLPPASFRYRLALCVCPNRSPSFPFYRLAWKKGQLFRFQANFVCSLFENDEQFVHKLHPGFSSLFSSRFRLFIALLMQASLSFRRYCLGLRRAATAWRVTQPECQLFPSLMWRHYGALWSLRVDVWFRAGLCLDSADSTTTKKQTNKQVCLTFNKQGS